jgi:hypothetical protein
VRALQVEIVTPAPRGSRGGNRVTALRWARILRSLGHRARVGESWSGEPCALLVALHAEKSAESVERFARAHPSAPIAVALTGTDLYGDIGKSTAALRSLRLARVAIALQARAADALPADLRPKVRVIHQSAPA